MSFKYEFKKELIDKIQKCIILIKKIKEIEETEYEEFKKKHKDIDKMSDAEKHLLMLDEIDPKVLDEFLGEDLNLEGAVPLDDEVIDWEHHGERLRVPRKKEYIQLYKKFNFVRDEINKLMVECKCYPVMGLTQKELLILSKKDDHSGTSYKDKKVPNSYLDEYLTYRINMQSKEMKERLEKIPPLLIEFYLDPKTLHFYRQILQSYIFGLYESSCVLCRAIVHSMTRKYIENQGYGNLLIKEKVTSKTKSVQYICKDILKWDKKLLSLYNKICNKANSVLYEKEAVGNKEAIGVIIMLQEFIKLFPKQT